MHQSENHVGCDISDRGIFVGGEVVLKEMSLERCEKDSSEEIVRLEVLSLRLMVERLSLETNAQGIALLRSAQL